jgi:hypothetical protein
MSSAPYFPSLILHGAMSERGRGARAPMTRCVKSLTQPTLGAAWPRASAWKSLALPVSGQERVGRAARDPVEHTQEGFLQQADNGDGDLTLAFQREELSLTHLFETVHVFRPFHQAGLSAAAQKNVSTGYCAMQHMPPWRRRNPLSHVSNAVLRISRMQSEQALREEKAIRSMLGRNDNRRRAPTRMTWPGAAGARTDADNLIFTDRTRGGAGFFGWSAF